MTSKRINGTESIKTINSLFVVSLKSINLLQNTFAIGLRVRKAFYLHGLQNRHFSHCFLNTHTASLLNPKQWCNL